MTNRANWAANAPIVPIVTLMLGGAMAFFCFAMPTDLVERLVAASGLPALLPAAAPPLGMKARLLFAALSGAGSAIAVWLGFAAAFGGSRVRPQVSRLHPEPVEAAIAFPRARRADAHPDAPAPRPIRAGAEFGEPLELTTLADGWDTAEPVAPPASWQVAEAGIAAMSEPVAEAEAEPIEISEIELVGDREEVQGDAEAHGDAIAEPAEISVPPAAGQGAWRAPAEIPDVAALMARLETGLARRTGTRGTVTPLRVADRPSADPALREALDELQRLAQQRG